MSNIEDAEGPAKSMPDVPRYAGNFETLQLHYANHKDVGDDKRGHTAVYCGYDSGEWNYRQFFNWINDHLMSFALNSKEIRSLTDRTANDQIERAANNVYASRHNPERRGELAELILHGLIRDIYKTTPLISKIYRKTAVGDTVKGADCVHVIEIDGELDSLWLGEAKFKTDAVEGIRLAIASVSEMVEQLSNWEEFVVIKQHLDDELSVSSKVETLLSKATSLDNIKARICIPILVTYESGATGLHTRHDEGFIAALKGEIEPLITKFLDKASGIEDVDVHMFFMPIKTKKDLITLFDRYLDKKRAMTYEL